jgi:nickel-dependent lactate racemase
MGSVACRIAVAWSMRDAMTRAIADRQSVRLAYGTRGLAIQVPRERTTVIAPRHRRPAPDPLDTLRRALADPIGAPPLRALVRPGQRIAISVCDITRPQPRALMLQAVLEALDGVIRPQDVVVLIATGTHRANTPDELVDMLGAEVVAQCRVVNHDARDRSSLVDLGRVDDVPVLLNREWVDADIRITTGFVEPHFFAGFSGGPKMVAPGLAGLETVLALHDARRIGDPRATWGVTEGNPVHDAVRAIAAATGVQFALDILLNDEQRITQAFGGELFAMHAAARDEARREAMRSVDRRFDIVVTTNSGYPLDQNLYQAVKGMSAGATVAKPGGTIICAAECRDGLPEHGSYGQLLAARDGPAALLEMIASAPETIPDQWQVQIQARIQVDHEVLLKTDGLSAAQVRAAHLKPIDDITELIEQRMAADPHATLCVLPQGPQTIPYVA